MATIRTLREWWVRLRSTLQPVRSDEDLEAELRSHLELAAEQARRRPDPVDHARRDARVRAGGLAQAMSSLRDQRGLPRVDALRADIVFGWRQLNKRRTVSLAAMLSLGLAIGAAAAAVRLIDAVLLRSLPVSEPDRLFAVATTFVDSENRPDYDDYFDYPTFRQYASAAGDIGEFMVIGMAFRQEVAFEGAEAEPQYRQFVSGNVFPSFGLRPALGRLLGPADDVAPGGHPVAVLSYDYWTRRFARDPAVVGRTFRTGAGRVEIIGVAPRGFVGTEPGTITDVFVPAAMNVKALNSPGWAWFRLWVRPRTGVAPDQVRERLHALFTQAQRERVKSFPAGTPAPQIQAALNESVLLLPANAGVSATQKTYRRPLYILAALVALVLLIACANVANLMIAQTVTRAREMALRVSLGAGRARLLQLILVEGALLAIGASIIGLGFAAWSAPFVVSRLAPADEPVRVVLEIDWRAGGLGMALVAMVTLVFGLAPALRASAAAPLGALGSRAGVRAHRRFTNALIAAQTAFCVFVLFVAGLFVATFERLATRPLGFVADGVHLLDVAAGKAPRPPQFWAGLMDQLRRAPGVEAAAFAGWAPLSGNGWSVAVHAPGRPLEPRPPWALDVSAGFFATMRIPFIAGRDFRPGDRQPAAPAGGPPVQGIAVVNESFARTYLDGRNPVGQWVISRFGNAAVEVRIDIVGLVGDSIYGRLRDPMRPTMYFPLEAREDGTVLVRTTDDRGLSAATLRRELMAISPELRVRAAGTQTALVNRQMIRERLLAMLSLFFGAVGLLLAGVGLYGVLYYAVIERRREIGVRMALGARPVQVVRRVTAEMLGMVSGGAVAGLAAGVACSGVLDTLLFEVAPADPLPLMSPLLALGAVALVAALPSAVRAVRIDPAQTLRTD